MREILAFAATTASYSFPAKSTACDPVGAEFLNHDTSAARAKSVSTRTGGTNMKTATFTFGLASVALSMALGTTHAAAQTPRANGETVGIQNYASTTGNMHAIVAKEKGFCEKYNFKCEIKTINSTSLG